MSITEPSSLNEMFGFPAGQHLTNAVLMARVFLRQTVLPGDTVVDATAGNGHDTLFLSELTGPQGKVFSFDIQQQAIQTTRDLLSTRGSPGNIRLIQDCHSNINRHVQSPVKAVLFNLGYLPGGDRSVTTRYETTLSALQACLPLLSPQGVIVLVVYPGHPAGQEESVRIQEWLSGLDQKLWTSMVWRFLNQKNTPPYLLLLEKNQKGTGH